MKDFDPGPSGLGGQLSNIIILGGSYDLSVFKIAFCQIMLFDAAVEQKAARYDQGQAQKGCGQAGKDS